MEIKNIFLAKKVFGKDFSVLSVRSWIEQFESRRNNNQGIDILGPDLEKMNLGGRESNG